MQLWSGHSSPQIHIYGSTSDMYHMIIRYFLEDPGQATSNFLVTRGSWPRVQLSCFTSWMPRGATYVEPWNEFPASTVKTTQNSLKTSE